MFRDLGVSVDSSDHSSEATILALEFARTGGARISLRYAQSMRGDLLAQAHGVHRANEASTRAEAAARALGAPGKSMSLVTRCPVHDLLNERKQLLLEELDSKVAGPSHYEAAVADLLSALGQFSKLIWIARGRGEGVIPPVARRHLTAQDWNRLHAGFTMSCRGTNGASVSDRFACLSDALYEAVLDGIRPRLNANFLEA
jgi:hypothetical protein